MINIKYLKKLLGIYVSLLLSEINKYSDIISNLIVIIGFIILVFFSVILLSLAWTQISIVYGQNQDDEMLSDNIFEIIGINVDNLSPNQHSELLLFSSSIVAILVSFWFGIVPTFQYIRKKINIKKKAIIQIKKVYNDGIDDLIIMLKYYKMADNVSVYAGDFDWLAKNENLKKEIERLAKENKIRLYSYKNAEAVSKNINDIELFNLLKDEFKFDRGKEIKCSLIETKGVNVFLYKSELKSIGGDNSVCIVQGINEGIYLLRIMRELLE
ncbi:MAG: hypothetical protein K8S27_00670 [Candidatus Omnitrophica bacterium]|nr:hypothetical protein [Candidatus Omnitrophota bacterium]